MWQTIIGHTKQIEQLRRALAQQRLPNAYIFSGPKGIGKALVAETFTKSLFCTERREEMSDSCGSCTACQKLASGNHPDFFRLEPQRSERGVVQNIKIDAVRTLQARLAFQPLEACAKMVLIDDAHELVEAAANALLKMLEEPPPHTHFILISTSLERLLPTIRSRCQHLPFQPLSEQALASFLAQRQELSDTEALRIARLSGGSVGTALSLDAAFLDAVLGRFIPLTRKANSADILETAQSWKEIDAEMIPLLFDILASWYLDILRQIATGGKASPTHPEVLSERASARQSHILHCLKEIAQARRTAGTAANKQLMFEQLLFSLAR